MKRKFLLIYAIITVTVFLAAYHSFRWTSGLVKDNSNLAVLGVVDRLIEYTGNKDALSYEDFLRQGDELVHTMGDMAKVIDDSSYGNKSDLDKMFYELSKLFRNSTRFDLQHTRTLGEIHDLLVRYRYISTSQEGARLVGEIISRAVFIQPDY
ncbi:hypothetical protein [Youngiibacter multivorans]|uniref:Uncharacterized protein n=1 Tax=Youngiibacter multivorans TaxID=937251 RepID=A0ABS4G8M5_9CLOT|nr:hypothetical protein [Youngiibacter multivorans]MBP1920896.1 hypothetical protein [Youngiibacter multivorans]